MLKKKAIMEVKSLKILSVNTVCELTHFDWLLLVFALMMMLIGLQTLDLIGFSRSDIGTARICLALRETLPE